MTRNEFDKHGDYEILYFENILIAKVWGSWNVECATSYRSEIENMLNKHRRTLIAHILDLRDWQLGTPDALDILSKPLHPEESVHNHLRIELIHSESLSNKISIEHIDKKNRGILYFDTLEDVLKTITMKFPHINCDKIRYHLEN